jgi:hypothetical protein
MKRHGGMPSHFQGKGMANRANAARNDQCKEKAARVAGGL